MQFTWETHPEDNLLYPYLLRIHNPCFGIISDFHTPNICPFNANYLWIKHWHLTAFVSQTTPLQDTRKHKGLHAAGLELF